MSRVWIHHSEWLHTGGSDDYSVGGWDETRQEATNIVLSKLDCVPSGFVEQIRNGLKTDDWQAAIKLWNEHNYAKDHIDFYIKEHLDVDME